MKTLVLLISEQTIPNYLFIKTFGPADRYVFISTQKMQNNVSGNRSEWIRKAANLDPSTITTLIVHPEFKDQVMNELNNIPWHNYGKLIVNLTGGTKMMALAAWDFFRSKTPDIWYIPLGAGAFHLCENSSEKVQFQYLHLDEYLACCGIYKSEEHYTTETCTHSVSMASNMLRGYLSERHDPSLFEQVRQLRRGSRDTDFRPAEWEIMREKIRGIYKLQINGNSLSEDSVVYLTGRWFEELCFYEIQNLLTDKIRDIFLNVHLFHKTSSQSSIKKPVDNEFDVLFVYRNVLYMVECKTTSNKNKNIFLESLYKVAALRQYFMLTVKAVLCVLFDVSPAHKERARLAGIEVIDRADFKGGKSRQRWKEILNIRESN